MSSLIKGDLEVGGPHLVFLLGTGGGEGGEALVLSVTTSTSTMPSSFTMGEFPEVVVLTSTGMTSSSSSSSSVVIVLA